MNLYMSFCLLGTIHVYTISQQLMVTGRSNLVKSMFELQNIEDFTCDFVSLFYFLKLSPSHVGKNR